MGGVDKPMVEVGGVPMLVHVLAAVADARVCVVVGPQRTLPAPQRRTPVRWVREDPPLGGPVAALAAAVPMLESDLVVLAAADMPWFAGAVQPLLAAAQDTSADVVLLSADGRLNYLAAVWRRAGLTAQLTGLGSAANVSMRALYRHVRNCPVPDPHGWGRDYDSWEELRAVQPEREDGG